MYAQGEEVVVLRGRPAAARTEGREDLDQAPPGDHEELVPRAVHRESARPGSEVTNFASGWNRAGRPFCRATMFAEAKAPPVTMSCEPVRAVMMPVGAPDPEPVARAASTATAAASWSTPAS